jgi:EAL domain-containing protein (putative c-di-GMP-specific phosphodiesterase class I)
VAIGHLSALKGLGVKIVIDDFGTGYSSLSYLQRFPVDLLKVDRSFVAGVAQRGDDAAIVRGVVDLAHRLGLTAVAEGVEDAEQMAALRELGCERAQGYLLGRPAAAEDQTVFLATRRPAGPHLRAVDPSGPDTATGATGDTGAA